MMITRIDSEKEVQRRVKRIEIELDGVDYTLTKDISGGIRINCTGWESAIMVKPGCANEIVVIGS